MLENLRDNLKSALVLEKRKAVKEITRDGNEY